MTSSAIHIRHAALKDAEGVLAVYAPYVKDTPITFETEVPGIDEFRSRMSGIMEIYPYLVVENGGRIVGYAYAHRIGERAAYDWDAEFSIYLEGGHTGRGIGTALSHALLQLLEMQGVRNVFSLIAVPNPASISLHEKLGFRHMGTQERAGYKLGAWHDVEWMQKPIGDFEGAPAPLLCACDLDPQAVQVVLADAERACRSCARSLS